jgi:hypothetical protein
MESWDKYTLIDWMEIIKSNKGARTKDRHTCGNVIAEDGYSIIISEGLVNRHEFMVPKSKSTTLMEVKFI